MFLYVIGVSFLFVGFGLLFISRMIALNENREKIDDEFAKEKIAFLKKFAEQTYRDEMYFGESDDTERDLKYISRELDEVKKGE